MFLWAFAGGALGDSTWGRVAVTLTQLLVLGIIFRTWIGPFLLRKVSKRIKARSVSPRSIRGVLVRTGRLKVYVDRIGLSYHRPSPESARRFSVKIEGISVEIKKSATINAVAKSDTAHFYLSPSPLSRSFWNVYSAVYSKLEPYARPILRTLFVTSLRLLIRCLPTLSQVLDVEIDRILISFPYLPEAHFTVNKATLYTQVDFSNLETFVDIDDHTEMGIKKQGFLGMAHLRSRFANSARRAWGRAWGGTKGTFTVVLDMRKIAGFASPDTWTDSSEIDVPTIQSNDATSRYNFVTHSAHDDSIFIDLPGSSEVTTSFQFGPKKSVVEEHSVTTSVKISSIFIAVERFLEVLRANRDFVASTMNAMVTTDSESVNKQPNTRKLIQRRREVGASRNNFLMSFFRSFDMTVKEIALQFPSGSGQSTSTFRAHIRNLSTSMHLSNPSENGLHRSYLGKSHNSSSDFDAEAFAISFATKEVTVQRRSSNSDSNSPRIMTVGTIQLDGLISQWSLLALPPSCLLSGDANDNLLVLNLNISTVHFADSISTLNDLLGESRTSDKMHRKCDRQTVSRVPRCIINVNVQDIVACLTPKEEECDSAFSAVLRVAQVDLSLMNEFKFHSRGQMDDSDDRESFTQIEMNYSHHALVGPIFMLFIPHYVNNIGMLGSWKNLSSLGDPFLSVGTLELQATGEAFGRWSFEDRETSLFLASFTADLMCASDAISMELWQQPVISSIAYYLDFVRKLSRPEPQNDRNTISHPRSIPHNVSARFSTARLGLLITATDINPSENGELSRGVALGTGISIGFSSTRNRYAGRREKGSTRERQRLSLEEDLAVTADSHAIISDGNGPVLFRLKTWKTTLRTAIATKFAADHAYEDPEEVDELRQTEFLWIPKALVDMQLMNHQGSPTDVKEKLAVILSVPDFRIHLQLLSVYSALLAVSTMKSLSHSREVQIRKGSLIEIDFRAEITTFQVLVLFPLKEHLCLRINRAGVQMRNSDNIHCDIGTLFLWAPSPTAEKQWEEILRLRSWKIMSCNSVTEPLSLSIEGDGAHLRVPYGYVAADLILDMSVAFKAVRHLFSAIRKERFSPLGTPGPEDAKVVPVMNFKISCISIEFADDPLESKLGVIWRSGLDAARTRQERDEAFSEKAAIVATSEMYTPAYKGKNRFTGQHSISTEAAYERLKQVHSLSWIALHREYKESFRRKEDALRRRIKGERAYLSGFDVLPLVEVVSPPKQPPLLRLVMTSVSLCITQPLIHPYDLADFLFDLGNGLPRDTRFTLLIPLHLNIATSDCVINLRDYPLPLLHIPSGENAVAWVFDTDLVIAEEIGTISSVVWRECQIVPLDTPNSQAFSFKVPKTTMPVKTYANPSVNILTKELTELCWGVSINPALQDVMHIFDTLTTPPPDPSPPLGFWDKIRLILHWRARVTFASEVQLNLKGSRDPYETKGCGAGFAFCWEGNTEMTIGIKNKDNELLQVISDTMLVVIPDFDNRTAMNSTQDASKETDQSTSNFRLGPDRRKRFRKICAKFSRGIKWGIGFILERMCEPNCSTCHGNQTCRFFKFRPHFEVLLEPKATVPEEKSFDDSYREFRSDFIHLSTSLTSLIHERTGGRLGSGSFHFTPKMFAHFWAWWGLFDRFLSIPIRQGKQFPNVRPPSKKFGRHLATLKYRLSFPQLFITHLYIDDSRDSWSDGVVNCVGIKVWVDLLEVDMHQREQEGTVPGPLPNTTKKIRHKPFYAAEVKLLNLKLRAFTSTFSEPLKQSVRLDEPGPELRKGQARSLKDDSVLEWLDRDDFVEIDWVPSDRNPRISFIPVAACPRFTYVRQSSGQAVLSESQSTMTTETSRFGSEDTHVCLMGKEPSLHEIQADLAHSRIEELRGTLDQLRSLNLGPTDLSSNSDQIQEDLVKCKIERLESYVSLLRETDDQCRVDPSKTNTSGSYLLPSDIVCPSDWNEFVNVYHFHGPKIVISNTIRDVLMRYYHCSRSRKAFEYHLATRAVRYIRDQSNSIVAQFTDEKSSSKSKSTATSGAHAAAQAIRKILIGEDDVRPSSDQLESEDSEEFHPMDGWSHGVSLRRSHFGLLLKPQVILRSDAETDSTCILAAIQATLQSFTILDTANATDPISGRVMTRSHAVLSGLQAFCPSTNCAMQYNGVPLEVLVDLNTESADFDRVVPQTNATFRYDKFNRLRLRNHTTSVIATTSSRSGNAHLQHQMDLIDVNVPRFSVSANSRHYEAISNIITTLLLISDSTRKARLSKVQNLLFSYDFTDLTSAADVVEGLQYRLRRAVEREQECLMSDTLSTVDALKMKAHVFLLSEELGLIFDAIKLAQDRLDEKNIDQKSALKVHASSSEISWGIIGQNLDPIVKLGVRGIDFSWLRRRDGITDNSLIIRDLQAFDASPDAEWREILSKYREPSNHPHVKSGTFARAVWTVLAPVGGITVYEKFILELHPMRLQLHAKVGKSIMEYLWPARRGRKSRQSSRKTDVYSNDSTEPSSPSSSQSDPVIESNGGRSTRFSIDEARPTRRPSKRLGGSKSFSDLRAASRQNSTNDSNQTSPLLKADGATDLTIAVGEDDLLAVDLSQSLSNFKGDAAEMKNRSSQKTFIWVRIASVYLLLSFRKDGSFYCRDAKIHTRELEIRNQTWSFEELADQFIPSEPTWKGWVKVALHQPLVPVFPVARELLIKTKWTAAKSRVARHAKKLASSTSSISINESSDSSLSLASSSASPLTGRGLSSLASDPANIADGGSSKTATPIPSRHASRHSSNEVNDE